MLNPTFTFEIAVGVLWGKVLYEIVSWACWGVIDHLRSVRAKSRNLDQARKMGL